MSISIGAVTMFRMFFIIVTSAFFMNHAQATTPPKDTLTVERIVIVNNGSSSGKSITSHVFSKRFYNEADCLQARNVYRAENTLKIGPSEINADVATKAECDALDHRFEIQYQ